MEEGRCSLVAMEDQLKVLGDTGGSKDILLDMEDLLSSVEDMEVEATGEVTVQLP